MPFPAVDLDRRGERPLDALVPAVGDIHQGAGFVQVSRRPARPREGRSGAGFFGVTLLPPDGVPGTLSTPTSWWSGWPASGVNLVRLGDLDMPLGPGALPLRRHSGRHASPRPPLAMARLDHMIAALKAKGIRVALELLGGRRFRGKATRSRDSATCRPAAGAAAAFDPKIQARMREGRRGLPDARQSGDRPAPAERPGAGLGSPWAGEQSLFDLVDHPDSLTPESAKLLKELGPENTATAPPVAFWQATETSQWKAVRRRPPARIGVKGADRGRLRTGGASPRNTSAPNAAPGDST